ncbi:MAG: hypothetical protein IJQ98_01100 [Oscillospiraceae bacterium]|nr:hypothetical protein [Oscillospiraceae bacterium]
MVFTWIAVAVVAGLLIGFVTLSVIWTARTVDQNIRDRSLELLSTYDELLEDRSRELEALRQELEQLRGELADAREAEPPAVEETAEEPSDAAPSAFLRAAERISATAYQDSGAGRVYRKVREEFAAEPDELLSQLLAQQREEAEAPLFASLDYDTVYRLSTLPEEDQLSLLDEYLPDAEHALLAEYVAAHPRFDAIAFYGEVMTRASDSSREVVIRVADEYAASRCPPDVLVEVDSSICEGFQIEAGNVLYDYAIKTGEIG